MSINELGAAKMRVTFIHNSNGWGYENWHGEFFGYFESYADAQRDAAYNGYEI